MGLVSRADAIRFAKITTALSTDQGTTLDDMIAAATPVIERIAGPVELATKSFTLSPRSGSLVLPCRYASVLSIALDGLLVDPAQYITTRAEHGIIDAVDGLWPWPTGQRITVVVQVGSIEVPANVKAAALELVAYWWQSTQQSQRSAWQEGGVPMGFAIPQRVTELLAPTRALPGFG